MTPRVVPTNISLSYNGTERVARAQFSSDMFISLCLRFRMSAIFTELKFAYGIIWNKHVEEPFAVGQERMALAKFSHNMSISEDNGTVFDTVPISSKHRNAYFGYLNE